MRHVRWWLLAVVPVLSLTLVLTTGCSNGKKKGGGTTEDEGGTTGGKAAPAKSLAAAGYAKSLKGRVVYSKDEVPAMPMIEPKKDKESCPAKVPSEGWFVKSENKGVRYAFVFLKPPEGYKMPEAAAQLKDVPKDKDGKPIAEIELKQPHCQFDPRVLYLHPKQKLKVLNDSVEKPIAHDSNIEGKNDYQFKKTLPAPKPGGPPTSIYPEPPLKPFNRSPYKVSCAIHQGTMSGWIWMLDHPYGYVTDEDGNFELKYVPVPKAGSTALLPGGADFHRVAKAESAAPAELKMILCVWHEALTPNGPGIKEIGPIDIKVDEEMTRDIKIP